jgi:hypothetical protein
MTKPTITLAVLLLLPFGAAAAEESLRGSPASMDRQHDVALQEELTFMKTPAAIRAEVEAGVLTALEGNEDYRIANVSFAYGVPEVRLFVERLAKQYRAACGEQLVVTSLARPKAKQPRNAHPLSVHPAGMAVDLRVSQRAACRSWLETTLLSLEAANVLDGTRERYPPHYHVAVFPTPYREYVAQLDAKEQALLAAQAAAMPDTAVVVQKAAVIAPAVTQRDTGKIATVALLSTWLIAALAVFTRRRRSSGN